MCECNYNMYEQAKAVSRTFSFSRDIRMQSSKCVSVQSMLASGNPVCSNAALGIWKHTQVYFIFG